MRFIGRREGVPGELVEQMHRAETLTADNQRLQLFIAFNYGGRAEILDAARAVHRRRGGGVPPLPVRAQTCTTPT